MSTEAKVDFQSFDIVLDASESIGHNLSEHGCEMVVKMLIFWRIIRLCDFLATANGAEHSSQRQFPVFRHTYRRLRAHRTLSSRTRWRGGREVG